MKYKSPNSGKGPTNRINNAYPSTLLPALAVLALLTFVCFSLAYIVVTISSQPSSNSIRMRMNQRTDYNYYLSILEERSKALKGNIQGLDHNLSAYQTSLLSKDKVGNVDLGDSSNNLRTGLWSKTISLVPENQQNGGGESSKMMNRPPDTPTTIEKLGFQYDFTYPSDYILGSSGTRSIESYYEKMKNNLGLNTVLLIMASNRPEYLLRCLQHVLKFHPRVAVPIVVSEDGSNIGVSKVVESARQVLHEIAPDIPFVHLLHQSNEMAENGYVKLSQHFKWALTQAFSNPFESLRERNKIDRVIILEEDLEISSDFFEYFAALSPLLDNDEQLLAISAWNDNGQAEFVQDSSAIYRSDFFPGLGWMMNRRIWEELGQKWPRGYWDDWLREPVQRKGRHILRPEICRTLHYGAHGVSNAQYSEYLTKIKLNDQYAPFLDMDLSYLKLENWDNIYLSSVQKVSIVTRDTFRSTNDKEVSIRYDSLDSGPNSFISLANWAGVMDNIKANVPRTAYKGIVSTWKDGIKLHIAPRNIA